MSKYNIFYEYGFDVIEADDWEEIVWKALERCGGASAGQESLLAIVKIPEESND